MSPDRRRVHHEVLGGRRGAPRLAGPRQEPDDLAPADLVERDAVGDLVQPRPRVLRLLEGVVVLVRLDERVLGHVGGDLRVAHHPQEVGVDLAAGAWRTASRRRPRPRRDPRSPLIGRPRGPATGSGRPNGSRRSVSGSVDDHVRLRADADRASVQRGLARSMGQRRGAPPTCDARPARGPREPHPGPPPSESARPSSSSTASSGETGFTGRPVPSSRPAISRRRGMDLPVPVVGRVDLLAQRRGVEDEVVGRAVEARREPRRAPGAAPRPWPGSRGCRPRAEVRVVAARDDPHLERRARGVRGEGDAVAVLPDQPVGSPRSPRARAGRTGTRPRGSRTARRRRAPRRSGAGSGAGRTGRGTGGSSAPRPGRPSSGPPWRYSVWPVVAGRRRSASRAPAHEPLDEVGADGVQRPVLAGWRDDRPPRAGRARLGHRHLGEPVVALELAGLVVRADDVERVVLEHPRADAVAGRACEQFAQPNSRSSTGSAARAKRSRWNARSTTVATHQPVIGSLRSSNRPAAIGRLRPRGRERCVDRRRRRRRRRSTRHARRTRSTGGIGPARRSSRAIDVDTTPGIPHGSMSSKSARSTRDVERDAVVADAALDAQAEGADLARRGAVGIAPAAGMAVAPRRRDAERRAGRRRAPPRARGRTAAAGAPARAGGRSDTRPAGPARDRSPRRRARRGRPRSRARAGRRESRGCGPDPSAGRGSGRPDARAAGAGPDASAARSATRRCCRSCASR